jgi:osmotically-inducible protein OsmY
MKTDAEIREDVIRELRWDPQIPKPDAIGVAVKDGAVTLTGNTSTYAEKLAAARAAERVYGVKAVANDLKVKLSGTPRDDSDIAVAIAHILDNNVQIPAGRVQARVQAGWVTLEGEVEHDFQRREVERMVRNAGGVVGVTNLITISAPVPPQRVQETIEDTFKREAEIDARHIREGPAKCPCERCGARNAVGGTGSRRPRPGSHAAGSATGSFPGSSTPTTTASPRSPRAPRSRYSWSSGRSGARPAAG